MSRANSDKQTKVETRPNKGRTKRTTKSSLEST